MNPPFFTLVCLSSGASRGFTDRCLGYKGSTEWVLSWLFVGSSCGRMMFIRAFASERPFWVEGMVS